MAVVDNVLNCLSRYVSMVTTSLETHGSVLQDVNVIRTNSIIFSMYYYDLLLNWSLSFCVFYNDSCRNLTNVIGAKTLHYTKAHKCEAHQSSDKR